MCVDLPVFVSFLGAGGVLAVFVGVLTGVLCCVLCCVFCLL